MDKIQGKTDTSYSHDEEARRTSIGKREELKPGENVSNFTLKQMRRIKHRADWRLLPALGLMYGISLMDRKNVSNAAIAGMLDDLDLRTGYGYSTITLVFFTTYVVFQPAMAALCRKIGPNIFLSAICMAWGSVVIGFAGFFPGAVYLLSTWYTRYEIAKRYSVFHLTGSILSAMSGILAYGLMQLDGHGGLPGWRWIFILEGILTFTVGVFAFFMLVKFPDQELAKPSRFFLKPEETEAVIRRLNEDRGDAEAEAFSLLKFLKPCTEIEIWGFALIFFLNSTISYSFAFFLPIVLNQKLKFGIAAAQCLGSPPYFFSAIVMLIGSWAGDRYKKRALIIHINSVISLVGLPIMGWHSNPGVQYFGIMISLAGVNSNVVAIMAYQANNIRGQWKRAFCSATLTASAGIGGISGSLVFRTQDAPNYKPGMIACFVSAGMVVIITMALTFLFQSRNKKADRGELVIDGSPDFRYTI